MASVSELVVGRDCSVLKLLTVLRTTGSFPVLGLRFRDLARGLGIPLAEGQMEGYWELMKAGTITAEHAVDILVREWMGRKEKGGVGAKLEELIAALDSVGCVEPSEMIRTEFEIGGGSGTRRRPIDDEVQIVEQGRIKRQRISIEEVVLDGPRPHEVLPRPLPIASSTSSLFTPASTSTPLPKNREEVSEADVTRVSGQLGEATALVTLSGSDQEAQDEDSDDDDADTTDVTESEEEMATFDVAKKDTFENTRLHRTATRRDLPRVRQLVRRKADLNARNKRSETPLHLVAHMPAKEWKESGEGRACLDIIKHLVEQGADVYAKDVNGLTFLHKLTGSFTRVPPQQFHEVVHFLLSKKHERLFEARDEFGSSPLHNVVMYMEMKAATLTLLRGHGVDLNLGGDEGKSVLAEAISSGRSLGFLWELIEFGADCTKVDKWNRNLLFVAVRAGNWEALAFLIKKGLDLNAVDRFGKTPLHCAVKWWGQDDIHECVQIMLVNGADKKIKDNRGLTPFERAEQEEDYPDKEMVLQLLRS